MNLFIFFGLSLAVLSCKGQTKAPFVFEKFKYNNTLRVEISFGSDGFSKKEINLFYFWDNKIKCHSIIRTTNRKMDIDTCFVLNQEQYWILDQFYHNVSKDSLVSDSLIYAGSYFNCDLAIDNEHYHVKGKSDISLAEQLLGVIRKK